MIKNAIAVVDLYQQHKTTVKQEFAFLCFFINEDKD
jgi:hypothetical protein